MDTVSAEGFIVHCYMDARRNRIHVIGRLSDGRSFAAAFPVPEPFLFVYGADAQRCEEVARAVGLPLTLGETPFTAFDGASCARLALTDRGALSRSLRELSRAGIPVLGADTRDSAAFLIRNGIRGGVRISGEWREGQSVSVVFPDPTIEAVHAARAPLSLLSIDLETEEPAGIIRAAGIAQTTCPGGGRKATLLFNGAWTGGSEPDPEIVLCRDERDLLVTLLAKVREFDPDIITGWNVIDFDFPRLAAAFSHNGVPFALGRSSEPGRFFPAETESGGDGGTLRRSASVFLPGRQVLDALRLVRTGFTTYDSYTLDAVAHAVLGKGKTVRSSDAEKLAELDRLYAEDPLSFCRYCLNDAALVLEILEKKDLIAHTVERAALTGVGIDKAWTSVASFERVYAEGLYQRGVLEPPMDAARRVSGAAGGTVLDPLAGFFDNVAVFDFRSLYPSVIRTFNIDPLAYERSRAATSAGESLISAPNGARFSREGGILPALIAEYFSERLAAIARGDEASAYVYKILMNSFYGVLGAPKCRYARTELAGAITSFGKVCLHFARDFFRDRGFRVLYGDTDSVFVELGSEPKTREAALGNDEVSRLSEMATALNASLSEFVRAEYDLESYIGIRFEKLYRRFFIPRLRSDEQNDERGRAKGYAGLIERSDGTDEIEIKGMEAARSDYTPLAQRFQRELLGILFRLGDPREAGSYIRDQASRLFHGEFDAELVFKKKLRREPESYTASTPPHIKVARALGWSHRRGTVEYLMTVNGPEAVSQLRSRIDYAWYASSQILPVARSCGLAAGFDADSILSSVHPDGQLEFSWDTRGER